MPSTSLLPEDDLHFTTDRFVHTYISIRIVQGIVNGLSVADHFYMIYLAAIEKGDGIPPFYLIKKHLVRRVDDESVFLP